MIDHFALAVDGVGFDPNIMATLGFSGYSLDIQVTERPFGGLPGFWEPFSHYKREFDVKFVITKPNGDRIERQYIYTEKQLRRLEKFIAHFKSGYSSILKFKTSIVDAYRRVLGTDVKADHLNTTVNQIIVKAKKNDPTQNATR